MVRREQKEKRNCILQNPEVPGWGGAATGGPVAPVLKKDIARFVTLQPVDKLQQIPRNPLIAEAAHQRPSNVILKAGRTTCLYCDRQTRDCGRW